ncbi:MAG: aromatic acid exporter family protein [Hydrogenoanaerobacterium sp.]
MKDSPDIPAVNSATPQKIPDQKLPKIGLRNIKTAISATLCAIIYFFIGRNPTFACIGAVFGMDNSLPASFRTGGNRLIGTVIGGFLGMGFFSLSLYLPYSNISRLILIFLGIITLIYISQLLHFSGAIQAGSVVFFIVMLNTPKDQYFSYAINRIIDTGFGVIMSIFINWVHIKLPIETNFGSSSK